MRNLLRQIDFAGKHAEPARSRHYLNDSAGSNSTPNSIKYFFVKLSILVKANRLYCRR